VIWLPVTNLPVVANGQWTVTVPIGVNRAAFYRLQY